MSSSATHARPRLARRLPAVAAPVLCGAATAFAVAGTPATSMAATQAQARGHDAAAAVTARSAVTHTVKPGDTLSVLARHYYQDPDFWPAIYWANHHKIRYANDIQAGQILTIPARPAHVPAAPPALSAPARHYTREWAAPVQSAPVQSAPVSTAGYGSFQQCVISHESGGNSQAMNSSGHYGLYQFSSSTWAAYGGDPSDFGHASVSEQNQVFGQAMSSGGRSNWAPYDGC